MCKSRIVATILITLALAGCDKPAPPAAQVRPVRTVTVEGHAEGETVSLTGQVRAKDQASLAFRIDGRMVERPVRVGDVLAPGQFVARLDPKDEQNELRSAQATLVSAQAHLTEARLTFWRKQELVKDGWAPRAQFDDAQQALQSAEADVNSAQSQVRLSEDKLGYRFCQLSRQLGPGLVAGSAADRLRVGSGRLGNPQWSASTAAPRPPRSGGTARRRATGAFAAATVAGSSTSAAAAC